MDNTTDTGRPASAGRLPRDMVAGLAVLAFCAAAYWVSFGIEKAPAALAQNVQPATFPRMVLSVIAVFTVIMLVLGLPHRDPARAMPKPVMLLTGAAMVAFVMGFASLGPLLAMAMFCLVMPVLWGKRPSPALVAYAIGFPMAVYLLFDVSLDVNFPPGLIERQLDALF